MQRRVALGLTAAYINQDIIIQAEPPTRVNPTWFCLELNGQAGKNGRQAAFWIFDAVVENSGPKLFWTSSQW